MTLLIFYPAVVFVMACMGLLCVALVVRSPAPWSTAITLIALLPVLPIITIRWLAVLTVEACDWLVVDRTWTIPSAAAARWLVRRLETSI